MVVFEFMEWLTGIIPIFSNSETIACQSLPVGHEMGPNPEEVVWVLYCDI